MRLCALVLRNLPSDGVIVDARMVKNLPKAALNLIALSEPRAVNVAGGRI